MKSKNAPLLWLSFILIILLFIPTFIYYKNFSDNGISSKTEDWSNFAGFIGDILSPVLNVINISIVFYLALKVNSIEENRLTDNLLIENQRRANDFKYNAFKEISNIAFDVIKDIIAMPRNVPTSINPILILQLQYVLDGHENLFSSLDRTVYEPLLENLQKYANLTQSEKENTLSDLNSLVQNVISELGFE